MPEGQKNRIEEIHKKIEDYMVEKARLTLLARQAILDGNRPEESFLQELHKIDEYIVKLYRAEIDEIKKFAKKIKSSNMANDLTYSEVAQRLYRDDTRIDKKDLELYNTLAEEMYQVLQEQNALYKYINRDKIPSNYRVTNKELEKTFRASIIDMKTVMPSLKNVLEVESETLKRTIDSDVTKRDFIEIDVKEREQLQGSQRNKTLKDEKRELRQIDSEIKDLESKKNTTDTIITNASKTQHEIDMEAHERRKQIQAEREREQVRIKEERRLANEARRQENLIKHQVTDEALQESPIIVPVTSIEKPKNKKSLKEKLKKVIVTIVVTATIIAGLVGINFNKISNKNKQTSIPTNPTIVDIVETLPKQPDIENIVNKFEGEKVILDSGFESKLATETAKIGDVVTIGNAIYDNIYSAAEQKDAEKPYFAENKEYTVIGVTLSNGKDTQTIYVTNPMGKELEANLIEQGYKPISYAITTLSPEEAMGISNEQLEKFITGYVNPNEVALGQGSNLGRGR